MILDLAVDMLTDVLRSMLAQPMDNHLKWLMRSIVETSEILQKCAAVGQFCGCEKCLGSHCDLFSWNMLETFSDFVGTTMTLQSIPWGFPK